MGTTAQPTVLTGPHAEKATCCADVIPIIFNTQGEPLHLGRTTRWFTPAQIKALWLRDGGRTYPGCTTPATWCDAHHIQHWLHGGNTDLTNATLLCGHHHTVVHNRHLWAQLRPPDHDPTGPAAICWDLTPDAYWRNVRIPQQTPA